MRRIAWPATGLLLTLFALAGVARAQDKLSLDKLPKPVQDAVKATPTKKRRRVRPRTANGRPALDKLLSQRNEHPERLADC